MKKERSDKPFMLIARRVLLTALLGGALAVAACSKAPDAPAGPANAGGEGTRPAANTQTAQSAGAEKTPGEEILRASAAEVRLRAGAAGQAVVRLDIAEGFHVNANPPSDKFYIGTRLDVTPGEGVAPGQPVYPAPLKKRFQFAERPLAVYEGAAEIRLPLRADASAAKGTRRLAAKVLAQPCSDRECLAPRTIETSIPVIID